VYYFFIGNLLLFFVLFQSQLTGIWVARAFFIWTSVFNLFIVSVFWSFMADIFNTDQARRLFGAIAAGGTAGALAGPALTAVLVLPWGPTNLLLLSAAFLGWAVLCIHRLVSWRMSAETRAEKAGFAASAPAGARSDKALGGSVLAGIRLIGRSPYLIGICMLMLLFTTLATFLYFQQAQIVRDSFDDPSKRTALFAAMDFSVNALTLFIQVFWTGRIVEKIGLDWTLALIPLLLAAGFLALWVAPGLAVIAVVQVARRAGDYAIMRPGREMLYVVLTREEKYKAKNFIDTVVYRAGDAVSAWVYAGLIGIGLSAAGICLLAVPLTVAWAWICYRLGRRQEEMAAGHPSPGDIRRRQPT
jgi:AAA family ATP:ADP antiporter